MYYLWATKPKTENKNMIKSFFKHKRKKTKFFGTEFSKITNEKSVKGKKGHYLWATNPKTNNKSTTKSFFDGERNG